MFHDPGCRIFHCFVRGRKDRKKERNSNTILHTHDVQVVAGWWYLQLKGQIERGKARLSEWVSVRASRVHLFSTLQIFPFFSLSFGTLLLFKLSTTSTTSWWWWCPGYGQKREMIETWFPLLFPSPVWKLFSFSLLISLLHFSPSFSIYFAAWAVSPKMNIREREGRKWEEK